MPKATEGAVVKLLSEADAALMPPSIHLAAAWKAKEAGPAVARSRAGQQGGDPPSASPRSTLWPRLGDADSVRVLRELSGDARPTVVRFHAAGALAQLDLGAGATAAGHRHRRLKRISTTRQLGAGIPGAQGWLGRAWPRPSPSKRCPPTRASAILRAMYLAGRNDPTLGEVASKFAGLRRRPEGAHAAGGGQARRRCFGPRAMHPRGEHIFRRADIGCIKCHAIGKAGGQHRPRPWPPRRGLAHGLYRQFHPSIRTPRSRRNTSPRSSPRRRARSSPALSSNAARNQVVLKGRDRQAGPHSRRRHRRRGARQIADARGRDAHSDPRRAARP